MPKFTRQFYLCRKLFRSTTRHMATTWNSIGRFLLFYLLLAVKIELDTDAFEGIVFRESTSVRKQSDGICYGCAKWETEKTCYRMYFQQIFSIYRQCRFMCVCFLISLSLYLYNPMSSTHYQYDISAFAFQFTSTQLMYLSLSSSFYWFVAVACRSYRVPLINNFHGRRLLLTVL